MLTDERMFDMHSWRKGEDWLDGTARYSIEGRDPSDTIERISCIVYVEHVTPRRGEPKKRVYYASVVDNRDEHEYRYGPFRLLKDAKLAAIEQLDELIEA